MTTSHSSLRGAYLNIASTDAAHTGSLNPSDLAYPQVMSDRDDLSRMTRKVLKLVKAPANANVIFNSGATESIATCIHWATTYNPHGTVIGSEYDHSAVSENCKLYKLPYMKTLRSGKIDDRCCMLMLTHVCSKTGEIMNVDNYKHNVIDRYNYLNAGYSTIHGAEPNPYNARWEMPYKPLIVLDATQSITKVPIEMAKWDLDAVFFSLHKIGGSVGTGVLVVADKRYAPFVPLIAGNQQRMMRGGTFPMQRLLDSEWVLDQRDDRNIRVKRWREVKDRMKDEGLDVYEPKVDHLYSTFLINVGRCPLKIINELALKGVFVGNVSACANEKAAYGGTLSGGAVRNYEDEETEKAIRISFMDPKVLSDEVVDEIVKEVKRE